MSSELLSLIVPLACSVAPNLLSMARIQAPWIALVGSLLVTFVAWIIFTYVPFLSQSVALPKAILLGYLAGESLVLQVPGAVPEFTQIALFLFLYYHSVDKLGAVF